MIPLIPIDTIENFGICNSSLADIQINTIKPPGENKWFKYIIVGGVIVIAVFCAYQIAKPTNPIFINKNKENG